MPAVAKICTVCGQDVAGKKRVKDPDGHYFCEPCFQSKKAEVDARKVAAHAGPTVSLASESEAATAPADDGLLDLAPEPKAKEEPMFGCAGCKKVVPQRLVRNIDGEFLCNACAMKRNAPGGGGSKPAAKTKAAAKEAQDGDENVERWYHTMSGGMLVSIGVVVLAFFIMTGLYVMFPPKADAWGIGSALLVATLETAFIVFKAGALIVSMLIAARILGGISFGYFGPVLFKSLALVVGMAIFDFFVSRSEAMFMLGFGFRWGILLASLIALFGIDYFEAMLLSVVNIGMMWVLAIAFAATIAMLSLHGGGDDGDEDLHVRPPAQVQPAPAGGGAAQPGAAQPDDKDDN